MPLQQVHLRINDAATSRPTPVRLRVTDAAGTYYPPHGHPTEFAAGRGEDVGGNLFLGGERWAYIDGSCEIALPPGDLMVRATKGPEYRALEETVQLPAGKLGLRFAIKRWTDQRASGWYAGDTRAHCVSPHSALLEAAAEDLAVVNLLARKEFLVGQDGQTHPAYSNLPAFSGQQPCLERDGHLVAVNTHNAHPVLGTLGLLHCHRVVHPLTFGGADGTDDWSLADWCGQCHRKNGLVIWTDAFNPAVGHAGEALACLILGDIDALELDLANSLRLKAWYHVLNAGFRVPLVAASMKQSNRTPLGAYRTYANCSGQLFSYTAWIDAVRAGRTCITAGPLISLRIGTQLDFDDVGPGGEIAHTAGPLTAAIVANSRAPFDRWDVVINGSVAATSDGSEKLCDFAPQPGSWIAARWWGNGKLLAHTSPIYVSRDTPTPRDAAAAAFLDDHLVRARQWVNNEGRFEKPKSRERLIGIFDAARERLAEASRKPAGPLQ